MPTLIQLHYNVNDMRKILFCLILFTHNCFWCSQKALAVPAYPYKIVVKSCDGKDVSIYMQGDEHMKFAVTEDGYTVLNDTDGWWYAEKSENGEVRKSSHKLLAYEDETQELKAFKQVCPKKLIPNANQNTVGRNSSTRTLSYTNAPVKGNRKALVILMQYRDLSFSYSRDEFDRLFNTLDYEENGATGSVRDYYRFASQSQLDYISDVYGPYTTAYPMSFYGRNDAMGNDMNPVELCKEALKNLPGDMDFSVYDNNNDGIIDNVHIIFAGYGEEAGASSDAIWSHEYPHPITVNSNGSYISTAGYSCSPELRGNSNSNLTHIGVICHELGHALGAMDYYDTNYGTGGSYLGTGNWDIMAHGSWNDDGKNPANFNPYVRTTVFGWNEQVALQPDKQIVMPGMETDNAESSVVYRMDTGSNGDYFLLENRQRVSFDKGLPGEGLMIYHVHPDAEKYAVSNSINAAHPQCLYPVCASGSSPEKKVYGNINSAECPFPGLTHNSSFSSESTPSAVAWDGSAASVSLSGISINNVDGSVSFSTEKAGGDKPDEPDEPFDGEVIYKESFENGMGEEYETESVIGKEVWSIYKKGAFIMNPDNVPEATDGNCILMLYSPKGEWISESVIKSPSIAISNKGSYTLSFDMFCDSKTASNGYSFICTVEDAFGVCASFKLEQATEGWMNVKLPLSVSGNSIRYILSASLITGGVFVDNVCLTSNNSAGIKMEKAEMPLDDGASWFSIDGRKLEDKNSCKGMYILRKGGRTKKVVLP